MIQGPDDVCLVQRAGLVDGSLPELQAPVHPRTRTSGGEHRATGKESVVPIDELGTERILDVSVVVQAAAEALDVLSRLVATPGLGPTFVPFAESVAKVAGGDLAVLWCSPRAAAIVPGHRS